MRKYIGWILVAAMCCGCDIIYGLLDKEGAQEKKLVGEAVPFVANPTVEEIQTLLNLYGYGVGRVDGVLGARTRAALEQFQRDNGLKETRKADQETWAKLKSFRERGLVQENKINMEMVQGLLQKAGFNPGKIDGDFGPKTITAVKNFQKSRGLKIDGKIGYQTLQQLEKLIAVEEITTKVGL